MSYSSLGQQGGALTTFACADTMSHRTGEPHEPSNLEISDTLLSGVRVAEGGKP